jgi:hypothetical protein
MITALLLEKQLDNWFAFPDFKRLLKISKKL